MTTSNRKQHARVLWQRVRSEPGLFRNVFVLAGLMVLGAVVAGYILSNQRFTWPWTDRFVFNASFTEAPAVSPGNGQEVRIAGVSVGEISDASVGDRGKAVLELSIDPQYRVYDNARLVLRPKSPLNEMYVELDPGSEQGKPLSEGQTLPAANSHRPIQVDQVLGHLDGNTREALTSLLSESDTALASAPGKLPGGIDATSRVVTDLKPVVEALQTRKDSLARLVTSLGQISSAVGGNDKRLSEVASSLQTTLRSLNKNSGPLNSTLSQLPDVTDQLTAAMESVQTLSGELDPTLDNLKKASGELPDALDRLTGTVDKVGETVDQAAPVVRKARPVVADLRPLVSDVNAALPDLRASTGRLDHVTGAAVPYLNDLAAFITNTRSVTSLEDANGGILRGLLEITPTSLPTDVLAPKSTPTPR